MPHVLKAHGTFKDLISIAGARRALFTLYTCICVCLYVCLAVNVYGHAACISLSQHTQTQYIHMYTHALTHVRAVHSRAVHSYPCAHRHVEF